MKVCLISQNDLTEFFITDPKLMLMGLSDEELALFYKNKKYFINNYSNYMGIKNDDNNLIAIFKWENFTINTLNLHVYITTKLQNKIITKTIISLIRDYFLKNSDCNKIIFMVPEPCTHVIKFLTRLGISQEGYLKNSYYWRQKLTGIFIFGYELKEELKWVS